jgi:hypothetical protein
MTEGSGAAAKPQLGENIGVQTEELVFTVTISANWAGAGGVASVEPHTTWNGETLYPRAWRGSPDQVADQIRDFFSVLFAGLPITAQTRTLPALVEDPWTVRWKNSPPQEQP